MNIFKFFRKKSLVTPVVVTNIYCDNCKEDNAIHVNVIDATRPENGDYIKARWLCKECIRVNVECGRMIEIL